MKEDKKPAIRFKGFTEDWEQRKLGDISRSFEYGLNAASKLYDGKNKYIRITDIDDETRMFLKTDLTSPDSNLSNTDNYILQEGDIVFARTGASVGKTYIYKASDGVVYYAGFLIRARIKPEYCSEFVFQNTLTKRYEKYVAITSQRSGQPGVNAKEYADFAIYVPNFDEQLQIGKFLKQLDNLITLHQRKYEKLVNMKKSMLEKMFPKNNESVPKIRFKGFTYDWEQCKFKEVFDFLQNNSLSRAELNNEIGDVMNIHYGDVLIKYGEVLNIGNEKIPYIVDNTILKKYQSSILKNGDVIIADAAEDETVGKCSEIAGLSNQNVLSGLHTIPCRPKQSFAKGYLGYYMNSSAYHDQLLPLIQGTKISSISKAMLQNINILFPKSYKEQELIGQYFLQLDNLITLHQRKLEKLKNIKKSCLEKMFI